MWQAIVCTLGHIDSARRRNLPATSVQPSLRMEDWTLGAPERPLHDLIAGAGFGPERVQVQDLDPGHART